MNPKCPHSKNKEGEEEVLVPKHKRRETTANAMKNGLTQGINRVGFMFLAKKKNLLPSNVFVSPFSVCMALGIAYCGSSGTTSVELANVLGLSNNDDRHTVAELFHMQLRTLSTFMPSEDTASFPYIVSLANSVWMAKNIITAVDPTYSHLIVEHFEGQVAVTDFRQNAEASRLEINEWVSTKTSKRIPDLLEPGMLAPDTLMVLVNALHFDAKFDSKFEKRATQENVPFHVDASTTKPCTMMHQTHDFSHVEKELFDYVEIPYEGERMSLQLVVPKAVDGLDAVMEDMSAPTLAKLHDEATTMMKKSISLHLPKFEVSGGGSVKSTLTSMELTTPFTAQANFSRMFEKVPSDALYFSDVVHKTFVKVDEEGTEAAAATATIYETCCVPSDEVVRPPYTVTVDRPSFLAITDQQTGLHLLLGKLMLPLC